MVSFVLSQRIHRTNPSEKERKQNHEKISGIYVGCSVPAWQLSLWRSRKAILSRCGIVTILAEAILLDGKRVTEVAIVRGPTNIFVGNVAVRHRRM